MSTRKVRQALMVLCSLVCVTYLLYRGLFTLNTEGVYASIASWTLFMAEIWGTFSLMVFFLQVWDPEEPPHRDPPEDVSVDVFVPSYNEDAALLRGTLQACLAMDYPHRTFLLDDGSRDEIRELCTELGVHYIRRDQNLHAKAGNLNNALDQTDGEFIAIFDADHVPEPHFLTRLLGHFRDEQVGLVQSPHAFYNFDTFQGRVNYEKGLFWDEGQIFYNVIQPGRNYTNSVIFAGSAAMFRRKALEEVGYIATETITEDMHTGIRLSAHGWRTVYVSERLIAGFGANDVTTFHSQRLRWAQGNLSILFHDNPLTIRGLSWMQRLTYFGSIIHWAGGIRQLIIYLTPIMMLLTGVAPVTQFTWVLAAVFVLYLGMMSYTLRVVYAGYSNLSLTEYFNMANFWTQIRATWRAVVSRKRAKFVVTKKGGGSQGSILPHILPQMILLMLGIIALLWGWISQMMFRTNLDWIGLSIATFLVVYYARYAVTYIRCALVTPSARDAYRHNVNLAVEYAFNDREGNAYEGLGVTTDISDGGLGFVSYDRFPSDVQGKIRVAINGRSLNTEATVRYLDVPSSDLADEGLTEAQPTIRYGVEFKERTKHVIDSVNYVTMRHAVASWYNVFDRNRDTQRSSRRIFSDREFQREDFKLPVWVNTSEGDFLCATTDLSSRAFRITMSTLLVEGDVCPVRITTPIGELRAQAEVIAIRSLHPEPNLINEYVLRFASFEGQGRSVLQSLLDLGNEAHLRSGLSLDVKTRGLPVGRPAAAAAAALILVTPLAYGIFRKVHGDDLLLAKSLGRSPALDTAPDEASLDRIYEEIMATPEPPVDRLILLKDALEETQRTDELVGVYRMLVAQLPADADAAKGLISALTRADQTAEAERICQSWMSDLQLREDEEDHFKDFALLMARNSLAAGHPKASVEKLSVVSANHPGDHAVRQEYAGALVRVGRVDEALQQYSQLPPSKEIALEVINVYSSQGDTARAEELCRSLLLRHPKDVDLRIELAGTLVWQGRFDEALSEYERLLASDPGNRELLIAVAQTRNWSGRSEQSLSLFQDMIDRGDEDERVRVGYLDAFLGLDDLEGVSAYTIDRIHSHYFTTDPVSVTLAPRLAQALVQLERSTEAVEVLELAVLVQPEDRALRVLLADTLSQAGYHERAHSQYKALVTPDELSRGVPPGVVLHAARAGRGSLLR